VGELGAVIWGKDAPRLPNTSSVWLGLPAADVVRELDRAGVAVSSASACSLGGGPSHVLLAMGLEVEARQTIRISTGIETGVSMAREAAARIVEVVRRLRA
jgi:cysteine desulfurase